MSENNETMTKDEKSANDSYLIIEKATKICINTDNNNHYKFAYRSNLIDVLSKIISKDKFLDYSPKDIYNSVKFREVVDIADKNGYSIYQLTRL